jgi:membrane protease YdiL (CAAX protease family)
MSTSTSSWRPSGRLRDLPLFLLGLCVLVPFAAWVTPYAYRALLDLGWLADHPHDPDRTFLKVFRRCLLVPLLLWLAYCVRPWRDVPRDQFGLRPLSGARRYMLPALLATVAVGVLYIGALLASGSLGAETDFRVGRAISRLALIALTALAVGVLEEWFFRGWLWSRLDGGRRTWAGAWVTSIVFAFAHAFRPGALERAVSHDFDGALDALLGWLAHAVNPHSFGPAFMGLFLLAMVLSGALRRTRNLWTAVGVHAGGVLVLFGQAVFTDEVEDAPAWVATKHLYDAPAGWALLGACALLLWLLPLRPEAHTGPS